MRVREKLVANQPDGSFDLDMRQDVFEAIFGDSKSCKFWNNCYIINICIPEKSVIVRNAQTLIVKITNWTVV